MPPMYLNITRHQRSWAGSGFVLAVLCLYYAAVVPFVQYRLDWTPTPLPADAPLHAFSEARALAHVAHLANTIGDRQISSPGLALARQYLLDQLRAIQSAAAANYTVEVEEQRVTGAISMSFTGQNFTNAFRGLSNVMVCLTPAGVDPAAKALIVISHYDSAVCSVGAADDASQVGVMVELARVVASGALPLAAPVIFLFTGGEESVSQAAHGFVASHPWMARVGAFINLEAMGGGGLPIVFQHTGSWVLEAYAAGAKHPRGTRVAQDVFDMGVIPGDSDYRMFSALHYGKLPGIDIAIVRDSAAYHTYLDNMDRIRAGVLQEVGDNVLGAIGTFTDKLGGRLPLAGAAAADAAIDRDALQSKEEVEQQSVYFDLLGYAMFSYRDTTARAVHLAPLILLAGVPLTSKVPGQGVLGTSLGLLYAAGRQLLTIVLSVGLPAAFGAARVAATGIPMVWFSHQWAGLAMFFPVALVGALLPWLSLASQVAAQPAGLRGQYVHLQMQGCALTAAVLAALATAANLHGSAFIFALSAYLALALGVILDAAVLSVPRLLCALATATVPIFCLTSIVGTFVGVMMERMALTGHHSEVLADVAIGGLTGSSVLALTCGCLVPLLAVALAPVRKQAIAMLLLLSLGVAAYAHVSLHPYSAAFPKRVLVNHILHTTPFDPDTPLPPDHCGSAGPAGAANAATCTAFASGPSRPTASRPNMAVTSSVLVLGITDSTPLHHMLDAETLALAQHATTTGREHAALFPLDLMLNGVHAIVPAPPSKAPPLVGHLPSLRLSSFEITAEGDQQLHLELFSELPCWGTLNITGPLKDWSFGDRPVASRTLRGSGDQYVVRFTTEHEDPVWPFWLTVPRTAAQSAGGASSGDAAVTADQAEAAAWAGPLAGLRLELSVTYLTQTDVIQGALARLPPWVMPSWAATVYQSVWEL